MSPLARLYLAASPGLMSAGFSHVTLVSGLANSWSHPLLAKRPSHNVGSGLKTISNPATSAVGPATADRAEFTLTGLDCVPATMPSCTDLRQSISEPRQCERTIS